jgi:hypothetical protein
VYQRLTRHTVSVTLSAIVICGGHPSIGTAGVPAALSGPCFQGRGKTLLATPTGRVYSTGPLDAQTIFGCLFTRNQPRPVRLPPGSGPSVLTAFENFAISGPWLAYSWKTTVHVDGGVSGIAVMDLRTGKFKRATRSFGSSSNGDFSLVTQLRLKPNGSVGFISEGTQPGSPEGPFGRLVQVSDSSGYAVLDRGLDIDPHSLELQGSRLSWRVGGETRAGWLR